MKMLINLFSKKELCLLFIIIFLFSASVAAEQNKVVVIPLFDDQKTSCVRVYDSSNPPQYLGIFLGNLQDNQWKNFMTNKDPRLVEVFIPNLNRSTYINLVDIGDQTAGNILRVIIWYDDTDCRGNPFIGLSDVIVSDRNDEHYYYGESPGTQAILKSWKDDGPCQNMGSQETLAFPAIELLGMQLTFPVTLPLNYESK